MPIIVGVNKWWVKIIITAQKKPLAARVQGCRIYCLQIQPKFAFLLPAKFINAFL
jgi:hypothetical protein